MIKILIVDDHGVVRAAISHILSHDKDFEVIGEAADGASAIELTEKLRPDVVLMDIELPDLSGLEVTQVLKQKNPHTKVLAITGHTESLISTKLEKFGADGYVSKETDAEQIIIAIKTIHTGHPYFSADIAKKLITASASKDNDSPLAQLSDREKEVVALILNGMKPTDIAKRLNLSPKTVNTFRYRIFEKLNITNDVELALLAIRHNIVIPPE